LRAEPGHCPEGTKLLSFAVRREAGRWVASVLTEREVDAPVDRSGEAVIGIDLGVAQPLVLSIGKLYDMPRAGDAAHLAKVPQRVASKVKGSMSRRIAISRLAAFKAAQARAWRDAMEKVAPDSAKNHAVVATEDLRVRNMTASARGSVEKPGKHVAAKAGLNRSILDLAPGALRTRLGHKLAAAGGVLLLVPPARTSRRCNDCGSIDAGNRPGRDMFACLKCGHAADADVNASRNIRDRAMGLWGNAEKVQIANSLAMLIERQARPKRSFSKKTTGGRPAQARSKRGGFVHAHGRKRVAATRPSGRRPARDSVLQGRE
jgi:putative transposase